MKIVEQIGCVVLVGALSLPSLAVWAVTSPDESQFRLDLADDSLARHQYQHAARAYQDVLDTASSDDHQAKATLGLGAASYALSQYQQARDWYVLADKRWPARLGARARDMLAFGDSLLRMRQWPRARQVLLRGYNLYPRDLAATIMLAKFGDGLRLNGNPRAAHLIYHTLLERHPQSDGALLARLGLAELAEGEALADEAREQYRSIVAGWPDRVVAAEALFRLGQNHQRMGEGEAASEAYGRVLERTDGAPWAAKARGALEQMILAQGAAGHNVEVVRLYYRHQRALSQLLVSGETGMVVGDALVRLGLAGPALPALRAVFSAPLSEAQLERALVLLADAYRAQQDLSRSAEVWQEYLKKFAKGSRRPDAQEQILTTLIRSSKRGDAETFCRQWLAEGSLTYRPAGEQVGGHETAQGHGTGGVLVCADLLAAMGDQRSAQGLYEGLLASEQDRPDALWTTYQLARTYMALGQSDQAADLFGRLAQTTQDQTLAAVAAAQLAAMAAAGAP